MFKYLLFIAICSITIISILLLFKNEKFEPNFKPSYIKIPFGESIPKEPGALPNDWLGRQRLYPEGKFNYRKYLDVLEQLKYARNESNNESRNRVEWEQAGPTNIGGRITDLAIHADFPNTIYVGAASGGIYKSIDAGETWNHLFQESPIISIGDLAIDPNNIEIVFAGTGEANASSFSFPGNGIYKSINGGQSWFHSGLQESGYFGRIIIDHSNSQRIFAATTGSLFTPNEERGIYRSNNGGLSWERILFITDTTAAIDLIQHPDNADILYAAMWERSRGLNYRRSGGPTSGIYKSINGGNSWIELINGLPQGNNVGRIGLTICKSYPNVLYAIYDSQMDEDDDYSFMGIFKTDNDGDNWQQTNDESLYGMNSRFGWYFGQIRVDPNNPDIVYGLGVDLVKSQNGGDSWETIAGYFNFDEIHVDHHAMIIDQNDGSIWIGNDGGLYKSENSAVSWDHYNNLPLTQFYAVNIDYSNPQAIYGGTQDNGTNRYWDGGIDSWENILGADGFYTAINPIDYNIIYAEYQWGQIKKSIDHGANWNSINEEFMFDRTNWSTPFIMDMELPNILYAGTYRVWKTIDGGEVWNAISDDLTLGDDGSSFHTITTIDIHPQNPNILIVGTDDGRVHIMDDQFNWTDISEGLPNRWITKVEFDPFNEFGIYLSCSGFRWDEPLAHVYYSGDLGNSWENISSNLPELPVNCLIADPDINDNIIIGTDGGVFISENSGNNWSVLGNGMPAVPVIDIKLNPVTRMLVAGTYGCSVFKTILPLSQAGDVNQDGIINITDIIIMVSFVLEQINPSEVELISSDLDENGLINVIDIVLLIEIILDL